MAALDKGPEYYLVKKAKRRFIDSAAELTDAENELREAEPEDRAAIRVKIDKLKENIEKNSKSFMSILIKYLNSHRDIKKLDDARARGDTDTVKKIQKYYDMLDFSQAGGITTPTLFEALHDPYYHVPPYYKSVFSERVMKPMRYPFAGAVHYAWLADHGIDIKPLDAINTNNYCSLYTLEQLLGERLTFKNYARGEKEIEEEYLAPRGLKWELVFNNRYSDEYDFDAHDFDAGKYFVSNRVDNNGELAYHAVMMTVYPDGSRALWDSNHIHKSHRDPHLVVSSGPIIRRWNPALKPSTVLRIVKFDKPCIGSGSEPLKEAPPIHRVVAKKHIDKVKMQSYPGQYNNPDDIDRAIFNESQVLQQHYLSQLSGGSYSQPPWNGWHPIIGAGRKSSDMSSFYRRYAQDGDSGFFHMMGAGEGGDPVGLSPFPPNHLDEAKDAADVTPLDYKDPEVSVARPDEIPSEPFPENIIADTSNAEPEQHSLHVPPYSQMIKNGTEQYGEDNVLYEKPLELPKYKGGFHKKENLIKRR